MEQYMVTQGLPTNYLFQTDPIGLGLTVLSEVELAEERFSEGTMATFSKQSELGM